VNHEILGLNNEISQKIINELTCPCINRTEINDTIHINRCLGAIDIKKILKAGSEIEQRVERTLKEEMNNCHGDDMYVPSDDKSDAKVCSSAAYFDQSVLKQVENEIFDGSLTHQLNSSSNNVKLKNSKIFMKNYNCNPNECQNENQFNFPKTLAPNTIDNDYEFTELEKNLIASVKQGELNETTRDESKAFVEFRNSTKMCRGMSHSLIDNDSAPMTGENSSNTKISNIPVRDCQQSACKDSPSSIYSLHASSTFTSKRDIFSRTMEVRRGQTEIDENNVGHKYSWTDDDDDDDDDSSSIEVVRHVVNFN
jgi:hypothetical protein